MRRRLRVLKMRCIWRLRREKATLKKSRKCTHSVTLTLSRFLEKGLFFPGGWEDSRINVTTMLVVSLLGVKCRFWSHLGSLRWKGTTFAHSGIA